jgi:hypothetical protein
MLLLRPYRQEAAKHGVSKHLTMAPQLVEQIFSSQTPGILMVGYFAFCMLTLFTLSRAIYNRYFHPLRHFPGPFWASITDFYLVYMVASIPTLGLELHQKYGISLPSSQVILSLTTSLFLMI